MSDYTIVGCGAIGSLLAAHLLSRGFEVAIVDRDSAHVRALSEQGIVLRRQDGSSTTIEVNATTPDLFVGDPGVVLLAAKSPQNDSAMSWVRSHLRDDGFLVVCQNGGGYLDAVATLGSEHVVPALINFAADRMGPGIIEIGGSGELVFGEIDGAPSPRTRKLCEDFSGFGVVRTTDNIIGLLWSKRIFAVLLTATAVADDDVASLMDRHRTTMLALAGEAAAIAQARGIRLQVFDGIDWSQLDDHPDQPLEAALTFLRSLPGKKRSGVFRDLRAHRVPTEGSAELGALIELAREGNVHVPLLVGLQCVISDLERGHRVFDEVHLDELTPQPHQ